MKKYVNRGKGLATVFFKDGKGVFLKRGQSIEVDEKTVDRVDSCIAVQDVTSTKTTRS